MPTRQQILAILFFALATVQAEPQISGMIRNYTALQVKETPEFAMLQNTFHLTFEQRGGKGAFNADIYAYQYGKDVVPELNMKQLYVDLSFDKIDFRLGRQQIIWGKADGVFITDVVSPRDLREFLLPDFTEIRQGMDGLNSSLYVGNHTFSLVLSPAFRPTVQPEEGSIWRPELAMPCASFRLDTTRKDVAVELDNSEAFFRWSAMLSAIDFELVAAWMWDDDAALHLTKYGHLTPTGFVLDSVVVMPRHHRLVMGGGSFSTTHNGFVFKGEAGYYSQKRFRTADPAVADGIIEGDYFHYMAGVSYTLVGVDLHTQFIQKVLLNHDDFYLEEKYQNMITALIHKSLLRETLHLDLFSYIGLNDGDALIRPSIGYDISDGLKAIAGANIFVGDSGYFGQFDENDIVYLKLSYSF
jgi:hypothetical protein